MLVEVLPELDWVRDIDGVPNAARILYPICRQVCGDLNNKILAGHMHESA